MQSIAETLIELSEFPGACLRRIITARHKSFDEVIEEPGKNRFVTFLMLLAVAFVFILI